MGGELELLVGVLRCFEFFRIDSSVTLVNDKNENGRIPILENGRFQSQDSGSLGPSFSRF